MNEETTHPPVDKTGWGDGPWMHEPDRIEWEHAGLPCLMVRNSHSGFWCGYAAVPPGHPLHGKDYDEVDVEVHGGLTYASLCSGHVCHVPKPGEPDDVYWFGFDCGHADDIAPRRVARERELGLGPDHWPYASYKHEHYVRAETERLAEQLAAHGA